MVKSGIELAQIESTKFYYNNSSSSLKWHNTAPPPLMRVPGGRVCKLKKKIVIFCKFQGL